MQAILARRQLEHGESLSHLTFRDRHVTQLRRFGGGADPGAARSAAPGDVGLAVAIFSDAEADAEGPAGAYPPAPLGVAPERFADDACDIS